MTFLHLLMGTLWLRPYVFIFLGVYLLLATWHLGLGRALAFLFLGYLVSWAAELCSITWGFPFGEYLYIPGTRDQELWVAGVPFMDSLSYVFLAYASYTLALAALAPMSRRSRFRLDEAAPLEGSPGPWILGAVLMVTLDIIIDPLALRGYRWFLGQIYGYPEPGVYFGIPLANFGGWFLVALVLIGILQQLAARLPASSWRDRGRRRFAGQGLLGPAFYLGILGFNLIMTFAIEEACLGWVGVFIYLPFFTWLVIKLTGDRRPENISFPHPQSSVPGPPSGNRDKTDRGPGTGDRRILVFPIPRLPSPVPRLGTEDRGNSPITLSQF